MVKLASKEATRPKSPRHHLLQNDGENYLFEVATGRILRLGGGFAGGALDISSEEDVAETPEPGRIPTFVPVQSFSLAIAQKCNLGCAYCYAEQGAFGGRATNMSAATAKQAVDRLFEDSPHDQTITLGFMGGEPLFNRQTRHETTIYAANKASNQSRKVAFSITTNATLIRPEDIDLFNQYRFTVSVSIDGIGAKNDRLRPFASGKGTYELISEKVALMLSAADRRFQVGARVTVTPQNLNLLEAFKGFLDMGFDSIRFSPMLSSPNGREEMSENDFEVFLLQLIHCGEMFREAFHQKQLLPLENVLGILKRIHNYQLETYPCGAGGGYMGVSAEGDLYACHRFVNDEVGNLGDLFSGVSEDKQRRWLRDRHLSSQGACNECWARHLCSGSCHHEVINRGRPACDYIRGWLHYCMLLYIDLLRHDPIALKLLLGKPS